MSVFGDFQRVWLQRFPHSDLPSRWEEDVRANLAKHQQKVHNLREELDKEEVYVAYLERLLSDLEEQKRAKAESENNALENKDSNAMGTTNATINSPTELSKRKSDVIIPSAPPLESPETENAVNKCVTELSKTLTSMDKMDKSNRSSVSSDMTTATAPQLVDPSSFVTVIEVNGIKSVENRSSASPTSSIKPPKPPIKPRIRDSQSSPPDQSSTRTNSIESLRSMRSSTEQLSPSDEPFYDMVAADDASMVKSIDSGMDEFNNSSTLPMPPHALRSMVSLEPQSPDPTSNYVNIEYFLLKKKHRTNHSDDEDSEDEEGPNQLRNERDDFQYNSSSSLESSTPASKRKFSQGSNISGESKQDEEKSSMYKSILSNIIDSESNYVEWLCVLLKYKKAFNATLNTSQPVLTEKELETIFFKIEQLHTIHSNFLDNLRRHSQKRENTKIGDCFKNIALNLNVYGAFLANYGQALDTVRKCSTANSQFAEIIKQLTCKQLSEQFSLEDLLHKPVARVQKNALVLHDLLKCIPKSHQDYNSLQEALQLTQQFLDEFNMIQTKSMFPATDRAQRRLVKNSFIVEYVDNSRKLRHLFLFNDVIACAKYKVMQSGRNEKYSFETKWFIPVEQIEILEEMMNNPYETTSAEIVLLKSRASTCRDQIRQEEKVDDKKIRISRGGAEKHRKRLLDIESQLVLVSPNLVFKLKHKQIQKTYTFFLSSEYERSQWIESIRTLKKTGQAPVSNTIFNTFELQTWISACRYYLIPNMGSYLLRSGHDESLLVGDLHVTIHDLQGLEYCTDMYICIEVDFYGHFFCKAKTKTKKNLNGTFTWNESFVIDLEGCENLRLLVYREEQNPYSHSIDSPDPQSTVFGKQVQQLSRDWLTQEPVEKRMKINQCELKVTLRFTPYEVSLRRVPTGKTGALFGEKIQQVCRRQKRDIPFIVCACIREVERRGMGEVGIYRVSGSVSDLQRLKKSFESNSYEAEQLLKEVDIHSVTGVLKLYLRELPEALFTDKLYPTLIEAFNLCNENLSRRTQLLKERFEDLPRPNKETIKCILDHLIKINQHENENKMSLHNLATVFGPTLLHPGGKGDGSKNKDALVTGTADVMAQAGILYCYLQDKNSTRQDC
ncbi:active breakpoint cluster region-related protein isoform X2 [Onthophagus taurus]|uniref:active breakpoint cluster region-related protein isoform X2 n=1 Tax=Onthophagus taurus TaxID=166361 RepID=UPI000C20BD5F|nr:active breakpoint cluster region-related protein isoform X2 [Onthophagus taurus]